MKPSLIIIYSFVCLIAFFGGIFAGLFYMEKQQAHTPYAETETIPSTVLADTEPPATPLISPSPTPYTDNPEQYILTASDNGISVYQILSDGSTSLVTSRQVNTSHLPQEDFSELCRGIIVDSREEAAKLLEDFSG